MSKQPDVQCGNPRHPNGAWHEATPLPYPGPSGWLESIRQWWRIRKYGCPCAAVQCESPEP